MSDLGLRSVETMIFRGLFSVGMFLLVPPNWCRADEPMDGCPAERI